MEAISIFKVLQMAFFGPSYLIMIFLFFWRRKRFPISKRLPIVVLTQAIFQIVQVFGYHIFIGKVISGPTIECALQLWLSWMAVGISGVSNLLRAIYLLVIFELQSALKVSDSENTPKLTKWKLWFFRNTTKIYFINIAIFAFSFLIISLIKKDEIYVLRQHNLEHDCEQKTFNIVLATICFPLFVGYLTIAVIVARKRVKESLFFRQELLINSLLYVILGIGVTVLQAEGYSLWSGILAQAIMFFLLSVSMIPPLWMSRISNMNSENKVESTASEVTVDEEEMAKPKLPKKFYDLQESELKIFANALALEFCAENLQFWKAVEALENEQGNIVPLIERIYAKFIAAGAKTPINLPGQVLQEIHETIKKQNFTKAIFSEAKIQIGMLLQDSYRRFKLHISPSFD